MRFKVFRYGEPMMLSAVLPVLHSLGVRVQSTSGRTRSAGRRHRLHVYDFGLRPAGRRLELAEVRPQVENAFSAAWRGEAEVDGFNELVLRAGLTWRQVVVLRAYAKYLRQAGTVFSQEYMESTFIAYPEIAAAGGAVRDPVSTRPSAGPSEERSRRGKELVEEIHRAAGRGRAASTRTASCAPT